jgi:uncharacterized protein (DUF885 family)
MMCQPRLRLIALVACLALASVGTGRSALPSAFSRLVDEYLDRFASRHPSIAAGNGLHQYDGRLDDFSATAIAAEVVELGQWQRRLRGLDPASLSAQDRIDLRILSGIVDGWLLDLGDVQTWRSNPMIYAAAVSDGVHNLMVMDSAPPAARMRQIISKLDGVPYLIASARLNLTNPPRLFAVRGASMFRATAAMLRQDLPVAFRGVADARLQQGLRNAAARAADAIDEYVKFLEGEVVPRAGGSFAIGRAQLESRYRAEELIDLPAAELLSIGERELRRTQDEFRAVAARIAPDRDPLQVWGDVLGDHPRRGQLVDAARRAVDELLAFVTAKRLLLLPPHEAVVVAPSPAFDAGLASMHAAPPLEVRPVRSYYYVTDASADWPAEQQDAWLQKFNYATLADITAHEVYPGHYAQSLLMRRTTGKLRRIWIGLNPFPQPSSGQDGWAHYAEQLVQDEGFHASDPRYKLAELSEALTRICRLIAAVRLHTGEWTVEHAAAFFEEQAHLPAPAARQEAERGTYDPTYGGYFLGKLAAQKLRRDVAARDGARFDLRAFHTRLLTNGIAPWWAQRQMFLPGDTRPVLE